ncbi:hypothetical protein [Halomonas maura]|uniref:hypothetical protein n=1 Tax=Halomonas maura TaxID=117606 RepID=UPI0025B449E5|nr:hypothetical protein [Halomonas maura]MDN3554956.1 hypothetical protein [Halomonas maura]
MASSSFVLADSASLSKSVVTGCYDDFSSRDWFFELFFDGRPAGGDQGRFYTAHAVRLKNVIKAPAEATKGQALKVLRFQHTDFDRMLEKSMRVAEWAGRAAAARPRANRGNAVSATCCLLLDEVAIVHDPAWSDRVHNVAAARAVEGEGPSGGRAQGET